MFSLHLFLVAAPSGQQLEFTLLIVVIVTIVALFPVVLLSFRAKFELVNISFSEDDSCMFSYLLMVFRFFRE